jgi:hypothetical protein
MTTTMKPIFLFLSIPFLSLLSAQEAKTAEAAPNHDEHAASSGIKKELIKDLKEADFIKLGDKDKTVKLLVVATWSGANYGMNFNGFSKGEAVYTIPKDWTVEVTFINPSPVPHSLIVLEKEQTKKIQVPEPYFEGGAVPKHLQGLAYDKATFSFTASEAGEFALACGFPGHTMNGHWIGLEIKEDVKVPTLKLGTKEPMEAKK